MFYHYNRCIIFGPREALEFLQEHLQKPALKKNLPLQLNPEVFGEDAPALPFLSSALKVKLQPQGFNPFGPMKSRQKSKNSQPMELHLEGAYEGTPPSECLQSLGLNHGLSFVCANSVLEMGSELTVFDHGTGISDHHIINLWLALADPKNALTLAKLNLLSDDSFLLGLQLFSDIPGRQAQEDLRAVLQLPPARFKNAALQIRSGLQSGDAPGPESLSAFNTFNYLSVGPEALNASAALRRLSELSIQNARANLQSQVQSTHLKPTTPRL